MPNHRLNKKNAQFRHFVAGLFTALFALLISSGTVFAAENEIKLSTDVTDLMPGQEVTVAVELPDGLPIYALTATLQYDQNIFEPISTADFTVPETTHLSYNANNREFGIINQSGAVAQNLFKVHLRVKDDSGVGDTNIALTNIASADGSKQTKYSPAITTVSVTKDVPEGTVVPVAGSNEINETPSAPISVLVTTPFIVIGVLILIALAIAAIIYYRRSFAADANHSRRPLYIILGAGAIVLVLLALLINFNHNKKDIDHDGETGYDDAVAIIDYLINATGSRDGSEADNADTDNADTDNADTDNAGAYNANAADDTGSAGSASGTNSAAQPSDPSGSPGSAPRPGDFDTNNDGQVDVGDAGHNAEQAEKETKVTLKLSNEQAAYVDKGFKELKFAADVEPSEVYIQTVKIGDQVYNVEHSNGTYTVLLPPYESAGKQDLTISEVTTTNQKTFSTNLAIHFEVLKDVPKLGDFDLNESAKTISFTIEDEDKAFQSGKAEIYHAQEYGNVLASAEIDPERTSLASADLEEDQHYQLQISGNYCRVEDTTNQEYCHEDQTFFFHEFEFFHDYRLILDEYNVTDYVEQGNHPILTFHSANSRNLPVYQATVSVNGQPHDYDVTQVSPDNYQIVLDHADNDPGKYQVSLDKITLSSLKTFKNGNEGEYNVDSLPYFVPGNAPTVEGLVLSQVNEENPDQDQIEAKFTLRDANHTASKLTVIMTDSTGKIVAQTTIDSAQFKNSDSTPLSATLAVNSTSKGFTDRHFTVKVLADYDLGDKYSFTNKPLASAEISIVDETKLKLDNLLTRDVRDSQNIRNTRYAEKGQKNFEFAFQITLDKSYLAYSNTSATSLTVNGYNYPVQGTNAKDRNGAVYLGIPDRAGVIDIVASRIMYGINNANSQYGHWYPIPKAEYKIEVLKDAPRIANLSAKPDYENKSVTFDFDIVVDETATTEDESFIAGTLSLGSHIDGDLVRGHNSVTFEEVEQDTSLPLIFTASYDRDTDQLNQYNEKQADENEYTLEPIYETTYTLRPDNYFDSVEIKDLKLNREGTPAVYNKNEDITANFRLEGLPEDLEAKPAKVVVQLGAESLEYPLTLNEDGTYGITLPGFYDAGEHTYTITGVVLDNGQVASLTNSEKIALEVLKDIPTITDFSYEIGKDDITVRSTLNDPDHALIGDPQTKITDESDTSVSNGAYQAEFKIDKKDLSSERYYVSMTGNYLLAGTEQSENNQHYHSDAELLSSIISLDENYIELKDVLDFNLYKSTDGKTELVDSVTKAELDSHKEAYFVELYMANLPTLRAKVTGTKEKDGILYLELEYETTVIEGVDQTETLEVEYGELKDGTATNEFHPNIAFQKLVEELKAGDDVTLERDYDAGSSTTDQAAFVENFGNGKRLDGAGHTIRNLKKPLFNNLNDATVENLYLENASLSSADKGILANKTNGATIQEIAVYSLTTTGSQSNTGGLIGTADNNTIIKSVAMSGLNVQGAGGQSYFGGIVGVLSNNSTIENSYAIGKIAVSNGLFVAGLAGNITTQNTNIQNVYAKVDLSGSRGSCGIACAQTAGTGINVSNSVSLSSNYATSPIGWRHLKLENNYYYYPGEIKFTDTDEPSTRFESEDDINLELFQTKANFDSNIWRLDSSVSYANPPKLAFERQTSSAIAADDAYTEANITAYNNLSQLTPFYESAKIVSEGNVIADNNLKNKAIKHLVPLDANGSLVTYLTTDNLDKLTKLRIIYSDNTVETYDVKYDKTYDMVASYRIPALKTDYNFPHYIIDPNSQVVNHLVNYLNGLDYTANLDTLTSAEDSRVLRDFYADTTKTELKEFVLKFLSSGNYTNTGTDQGINDHLERQIRQSGELERSLYVYNFLRRFYDLDFNGLKFYDVVLYDMQGYDSAFTAKGVVDTFLSNNDNFKTDWGSGTSVAYNRMFSNQTGIRHIPNFIEYVARHFSNVTDMNDWVHHQFKGFLAERSIDDQPDYTSDSGVANPENPTYTGTGVYYTLWDHFTHEDKLQQGQDGEKYRVYNLVLPILTLPKDSTYIISTPAQFIIGSQRTYIADTTAPGAADSFAFRVNAYANRMKNYYTTAYSLVGESKDILNNLQLLTFDKNMAYSNNSTSITRQYRESTTDPHHKNFNEVIGRFAGNLGINAGAYGDRVEFDAAGVMDATIKEVADHLNVQASESTFGTWSHETAHMIDARLWLMDNGRRWDAGGEDYADGNLRQEFDKNLIVMNLTRDMGEDCEVASPCSYERINTPDEIKDFYGKAFDVIYAMDYLEGLAFLQLTPAEQYALAVQISYPNEEGKDFTGTLAEKFPNGFLNDEMAKYRAQQTTRYSHLSEEAFKNMELDTVEDLYENRLMITPGVYKVSSRASNSYGGEGINTVHWYQPHNDYGRPDSYSLKWFAYEMLGFKGYQDGYIEYYSNIHPSDEEYTYYEDFEKQTTKKTTAYKTDLMAIRKITDDPSMDYDKYKLQRIKDTADKLDKLNKVVDVKDYVKRLYEAMKQDVEYQDREIRALFSRSGGETKCLGDYWCLRGVSERLAMPKTTAVRQEFYQALKTATNDFVDDTLFSEEKQQDFDDIKQLRHLMDNQKTTPTLLPATSDSTDSVAEPAADQQQDIKNLDIDDTSTPVDDFAAPADE